MIILKKKKIQVLRGVMAIQDHKDCLHPKVKCHVSDICMLIVKLITSTQETGISLTEQFD